MRVSVTISEELNNTFVELSKKRGISKDKLIGELIISSNEKDLLIEELKKENQLLKSSTNKHNERGAGRKQMFGEAQKMAMKDYRDQGYTIKQISKIFNCSVGIVHKLINE